MGATAAGRSGLRRPGSMHATADECLPAEGANPRHHLAAWPPASGTLTEILCESTGGHELPPP